ncbi:DUF4034 domain-containing protein [Rouxiella chamberiensis]|uniref:DUF4034 domain-containing protein n=1 Tax=Rouxiella chamberiensis TaxID=1513468 RepID=A0ABY7HQF0_9GAMM|nr:DUF4034 domain-containing protein [Rouxiella chamberiensis]WAT01619.1 DUF4034 domain-containing protein [Rouxiella chamberiensis]
MQQPDNPDNIAKAQMLLATRRFLKLDEWLLSQMRGWQNQSEADNAYGLIMHPDTLVRQGRRPVATAGNSGQLGAAMPYQLPRPLFAGHVLA